MKVKTGLDLLIKDPSIQDKIQGKISYICHNASISRKLIPGPILLKSIFKDRLISLMGPQHGFVSDVQDNMVETEAYHHPYFNLPIHSLYSETRRPTNKMLEGVDSVIFDLQDVGCRIYTYITTLKYVMEECAKREIALYILDRPNPISGLQIEGNILEEKFLSFVGADLIPVRHGMTMGEMANFFKEFNNINVDLTIIPMKNWNRHMYFDDTLLPWINPSPNMASQEAAIFFPGTVIFEGTNISEGRGTTTSLQLIGHPKIEPFSFLEKLNNIKDFSCLEGFKLIPTCFLPTFQKHANLSCGGFLLKVTDRYKLNSWALSQLLLREFKNELGSDFQYKNPPYEYEHELMPIDLINGSEKIRHWIDSSGNLEELFSYESEDMAAFMEKRLASLIYPE